MRMIIIALFVFTCALSGTYNASSENCSGILGDTVKYCPVSGDEILNESVSFSYIDKDILFCNDGCIMAFKKEPANYLNSGIKCMPCNEDDTKKNISVMHEGVKYYFCSEGCKSKFDADAEKYLNEHKK